MSTAALKQVASGNKPAVTKQDAVGSLVESMKAGMAAALPKHMNADRMARVVLTEMRRVPALANCDKRSLMGAIITCSQLGLEPGNSLGHAYLLPFGKEVTLIIGYRGLIDMARRSGQIISISARAVHEHDHFIYRYGLDENIEHIPADGDRGELTHVYAVAKLKDGGVQFEVMSRADVEKVRATSKAGKNGPWVSHFVEMARKTVVRRLFKYLPVSIEIQRAVTIDEQADANVPQDHNLYEGHYEVAEDEPPEPVNHITFEHVAAAINAANSLDSLDVAGDLIGAVEYPEKRGQLSTLFEQRKHALKAE